MEGIEQEKKVEAFTFLSTVPSENVLVDESELDPSALLMAKAAGNPKDYPEFNPLQNQKLLRKLDWHILPLMLVLYMLQFLAKTSLGFSTLLNLKSETGTTQAQYNILSTIFYVSYLVFEFPQSLALQRFPVGKWIGVNISAWCILILLHAACTNFTGLLIVRLLLGIAEGSITPGFMIVTSMYYTAEEQAVRVGSWFLMNGTATIVGASITYGLLSVENPAIPTWKALYVIIGGICGIFGILWWIYFPDSPTSAWFLSEQEKVAAIRRIKINQSGVENKNFKRNQCLEALTDTKVWLFCLFSFFDNIPNALTNQSSIIFVSLGFTNKTSALLNYPPGIIEILTIGSSIFVLRWFPNNRAYIAIGYSCFQVFGSMLVLVLPQSNPIGKLVAIFLTGAGVTCFTIALSWLQATTAGHTKRITAQTLNLCAYCIGNIIGPQIWQEKFSPVNTVPWAIVLGCYATLPFILIYIRIILKSRNDARDSISPSEKVDDFVDIVHKDGTIIKTKLDKALMDYTDLENVDFRYVL